MKHVGVFTSSRSDWGLLEGLVKAIDEHDSLRVTVLATGSHFDHSFGRTIDSVVESCGAVTENLDAGSVGNSPADASKMAANILSMVGDWLEKSRLDCLVVLGDRFEALSCALAAVLHSVPIVHLHGGEVTTGAIDNSIRHSISKLAQLHFPCHEEYGMRLVQMGEDPETVVVTGSLGLEYLSAQKLLTSIELEAVLSCEIPENFFVCAIHPVTTDTDETSAVLAAFQEIFLEDSSCSVFFTAPAPDPGFERIREAISSWCTQYPNRVIFRDSLGLRDFLSLVGRSAGLVGNSSSGILEVPSLGVPTINIGSRQEGRVRAASVVDAAPNSNSVRLALDKISSVEFRKSLMSARNPYEGISPTIAIIDRILKTDFRQMRTKPFFEAGVGP